MSNNKMSELNERVQNLEKSNSIFKVFGIAITMILSFFIFYNYFFGTPVQIQELLGDTNRIELPGTNRIELPGTNRIELPGTNRIELPDSKLNIESGTIELAYAPNNPGSPRPVVRKNSSGLPERGTLNGRVNFTKEFLKTPKVVLALNYIDSSRKENLRLDASVVEVDRSGFKYNLLSWDNTHIYSAKVSWIAYGLTTTE